MQYPNIGNPSPQEIYDSYSQIPNTAQGKQQLSQLIQAFKNSGDMRGGIATSILNSYNSQQASAPPAPQGQIADQVIAQAQPQPQAPMDPNMLGIAAPGLETSGPPGMAGGGLVAFAEGGPVRGFWDGGSTDSQTIPSIFEDQMPQVPEAPDLSGVMQDYLSTPRSTATRTVGAGESSNQSMDEKVKGMMDLYGAPPDIAAELISKMEHDKLKREKFNTFENIASGLAGYLGSYGTGAHRAGAGIASMLSTMGAHDKAASEEEGTINALRMKAAMQPYEIHKDLVNQVLAAQTAHQKEVAAAQLKMWEAKYGRETEYMKQQHQTRREEIQGQTSRDVGAAHDTATVAAARLRGGDKTGPAGMTWNQAYERAEKQVLTDPAYMKLEKSRPMIDSMAEELYNKGRVSGSGAASQPSSPAGQPIQLQGKNGGFTGWLTNN